MDWPEPSRLRYTMGALRLLTRRSSQHNMESLMYRMFKTLPSVATACVLAATLAACNGSPSAPSSSDAAANEGSEAGPNGETLKVQAPSLNEPANDLRLDTRKPTLVATNVAGKFVGGNVPGPSSSSSRMATAASTPRPSMPVLEALPLGCTRPSSSATLHTAGAYALVRATWLARGRRLAGSSPCSKSARPIRRREPGCRFRTCYTSCNGWSRKTPASCRPSARARKRSSEAITFAGGSSWIRSLTRCGSKTRAGATTGSAAMSAIRHSTSSSTTTPLARTRGTRTCGPWISSADIAVQAPPPYGRIFLVSAGPALHGPAAAAGRSQL